MKRLSVLTLTAVLLLGVVGITGAEEIDVYIEVGKYASTSSRKFLPVILRT